MPICKKCGSQQKEVTNYCSNCGEKLQENSLIKNNSDKSTVVINKINKRIEIKNNQSSLTKRSWLTAGFFLLIVLFALMEIITIHPALFFLSGFFFVCFLLIGFMLRSREKKLQSLISGKKLIASWTLSNEQKLAYSNFLFQNEKNKNTIILFSISFIAVIVFGIFIAVIDEGKLAMLGVLVGLIIFLSLFAFGAPFYYRFKNIRNDGEILIGVKYAYVNGYFHNWDFPLSGISKIKIIEEPFYGINLVYYYTDRTLTHSESLFIPTNKEIDIEEILKILVKNNSKRKRILKSNN